MSVNKIVPNAKDMEFVTFKSNEEQRLVKARFWDIVKESPVLDATSMSIETMCSVAGGTKLRGWLQKPEFRSWFFNENHAHHKVQAAVECAVDTLVSVMTDDSDLRTASSRVKAAEILLRLGKMEPPKQVQKEVSDATINKMDKEDLQAYIEGKLDGFGFKKLKEGDKK